MTRGACSSGDALGAQAGVDMLAAGGNAVDAVVAASFMACFTLPTMTSLGGGGVMSIRAGGRVHVCDHFARISGLGRTAPRRVPDVVEVPFEGVRLPFRVGRPSIAVPGAVAGLFAVHERFGALPLAEVARPAIDAAKAGVEVTPGQTRAFALLEPIFRRTPEAWALIGHEDRVLQPGEHLRNPDLADTLDALVREGPRLFYEGEIAARCEAISDGYLTREDLRTYEPVFRSPLRGTYRGWQVAVPGAPSLTGAQVLAALRHLEAGGPMPAMSEVPYWQRLADALRASGRLRTDEYLERIFEPGYLDDLVATSGSGCTMQVSAVDEDGVAVSYTTTVGEGAGFVIPHTGIMLNNFLGESDIQPDHLPLVPGQRMRTGMCPTLLHDGGHRLVALGAAGSARIRSAVLQVIAHVVDAGLPLQDAVSHPRIHTEDATIFIEAHGRTPEEVERLRPLGDEAVMTYELGFFFGGVQAALATPQGFSVGADIDRRGCAGRTT